MAVEAGAVHCLSVVIPVYRGERTLPDVVNELLDYTTVFTTPEGHRAKLVEIVLVHDHGPDASASVIRRLSADQSVLITPVWLTRNYGQHAATLAGMAQTTGDWIITMDEDGQHDPASISGLLDTAMRDQTSLVYARPINRAPHGLLRNSASKVAKRVVDLLSGSDNTGLFNSFRLILGDHGRSVAAVAGPGVYLDVALGWVTGNVATSAVRLRAEGDRPSGYSYRRLFSHFWRMVLTSGTRLLRVVSIVGLGFGLVGLVMAGVLVVNRIRDASVAPGWTSTMVVVLLSTGALLGAIGIVAEYVGVSVNMAMGRPLYLTTSDPTTGPLSWPPAPGATHAPGLQGREPQ